MMLVDHVDCDDYNHYFYYFPVCNPTSTRFYKMIDDCDDHDHHNDYNYHNYYVYDHDDCEYFQCVTQRAPGRATCCIFSMIMMCVLIMIIAMIMNISSV